MDEVPQFPAGPPTESDASPVVTRPARPLPARALDRPPPRWSTAIAAAGATFAITGSLTVSGDALDGAEDTDGSQLPGVLVSLLLLAAGLALLTKGTSAALRTAGSVAAVLAVPAVMFFVTFDADGLPPFPIEGILGVSAAVWIGFHFFGPTAGRLFPLGAGAVALWLFLLQVTEEPFSSPFDIFGFFFFGGSTSGFEDDPGFGRAFDVPDPTNMGGLTLLLAAAFLYAAHRSDQAGLHGRAFAIGAPVVVMTPVGVALLASDLEEVGSGLALCALGVGLSLSGAGRERRGTTWAGALFLFYGLGLLVDEVAGDEATPFGVVSFVVGAAVVVVAHLLSDAVGEPDELAPVPQPSTGSTHPWGPPPGPPDAPVDGGLGS